MRNLDANSRAVFLYLSGLDCPRALTVWILYRHKHYEDVVNLTVEPNDYSCDKSFRDAFLSTKLLSKANFFKIKSINRKDVAMRGFVEAEKSCLQINRSFNHDLLPTTKAGQQAVIQTARRKVFEILGSFDAEEFVDSCNWGPGVTLDIKKDTSGYNKFRFENGITKRAFDLVGCIQHHAYPSWSVKFKQASGNVVATVPKNAKTDRTIAIEPGINLWYQKGIGAMIRKRLKRIGIDLNSQERNQQLALLASKTGHLATVDFSAASDTISRKIVELLLPETWFVIMDAVRSHYGTTNDSDFFKYQKFSSMGNGFTFELESLIFFALAYAVCFQDGLPTEEISVYGDDVIIPSEAFLHYAAVCKLVGFSTNLSKSFSNGYFRESCGEYYYNGVDCKPYFFKESIINDEDQCYKAANSVRRIAHRSSSQKSDLRYCDSRLYRCWYFIASLAGPKPCLISEGYGDGGLIVNFDEACPVKRTKNLPFFATGSLRPSSPAHGIEGYYVKARVAKSKDFYADDQPMLLYRLKVRSVDLEYGNMYAIRDHVRVSRKRLLVRQWYDLGPWQEAKT